MAFSRSYVELIIMQQSILNLFEDIAEIIISL